jgi:hypothetical protein
LLSPLIEEMLAEFGTERRKKSSKTNWAKGKTGESEKGRVNFVESFAIPTCLQIPPLLAILPAVFSDRLRDEAKSTVSRQLSVVSGRSCV